MNKRNFDILGIPPTTDKEKIKKAYRKKALLYHPDRNSDPKAHQLFIKITEAYETLVSQEKRQQINQNHTPKETEEELKKRQFEERLKKARFRYDILKKLEEIENEKYYLKITSGLQWHVFIVILFSSLIFSVLITVDHFATPQTSFEFIPASN
ncbi:MAG: DnaJ domain-containing protein, partial [Crocinitomicaceae bacterium]|nr:DnaJ domain-containing protein [Crocinitomicaceae bacterium]